MEKNFKNTAKATSEKACQCAEKGWNYAKRYFDLKEQLMASWVIPFLQKHLALIYTAGLVLLAVWAVIVIGSFDIYAIIVRLAIVSLTFIVFRTLCEIVAACPTELTKEKPVKAEKAAKAAPAKTPAKFVGLPEEKMPPIKSAKKAKKSSKRKAKKVKKSPVKKSV